MFSRKSSKSEAASPDTTARSSEAAGASSKKKGRPTRSRKEAEAARQRPLVPADRKEAKRIARRKRNEAYQREQEALITGDERYLPWRDKGRVRRWVRDWVDARWSASEFLLPVMVLFLAAMMLVSVIGSTGETAQLVVVTVTVLMYGLFALSIVEGVVVWMRLKKRLAQALPEEEIPRGTWFYVYSRMIMARRWRSPRPQVKRGEFPKARS